MSSVKRWSVDIFIGESDGRTTAEARLVSERRALPVVGHGVARLNPHDADIPEIGDEVAVGRALADLGKNLLDVAQSDIEDIAVGEATVS
jgi:hypothetical protein